jgi:hypothetical protein
MNKKFIVRLSDEERGICQGIVKKLKGSSQKVRRAQVLLKADADGPGWTDGRIAEAFNCRVQTVENLRSVWQRRALPWLWRARSANNRLRHQNSMARRKPS